MVTSLLCCGVISYLIGVAGVILRVWVLVRVDIFSVGCIKFLITMTNVAESSHHKAETSIREDLPHDRQGIERTEG